MPVTTIAALLAKLEPAEELKYIGEVTSFCMPFTAIRPSGESNVSLTETNAPSSSVIHSETQPVPKKKPAIYHAEVSVSIEKYIPASSQSAIRASRLSTSSSGMTLLS